MSVPVPNFISPRRAPRVRGWTPQGPRLPSAPPLSAEDRRFIARLCVWLAVAAFLWVLFCVWLFSRHAVPSSFYLPPG